MKNKTPDFAYHMTKFFTEYLPIQRNLSPNSIATYRDTALDIQKQCIYYKQM